MKILIIAHSFYKYHFGGTEYQLYLMAKYLIKKGFDVNYIFITNGKNNIPTKIGGIKLFPLKEKYKFISKLFGKTYIYYKKEIDKIIKEINPGVVIHRNLSSIFYSVIKYNNIKTILHIAHKKDVSKRKIKFNRKIMSQYLESKYKGKVIKNVDYIIGQSQYQDYLLKKNYNRKCNFIVPNFHPKPKEEIVKKNPIKILWIANWIKWKQPEKFIELAEKLNKVNAKFIIIGRDTKNKWSEELKANINEIDNLEYLGEQPIEKVNKLLAESHIFVNTSLYEGFPNTFIQAWMRRVPVVSLHVDPDDVLVKNKIGFHSRYLNQMIKDVLKLIDSENIRKEMGERAQEYAFKRHSLKNIETLENKFFKGKM